MINHTVIHEKIPDNIFQPALAEVLKIDWTKTSNMARNNPVFETSITEHLRVHDAGPNTPRTIEALSAIVNCRDTALRNKYSDIENLITWVKDTVKATREGRIMIINIISGGEVLEHVDPGKYFRSYHRFHVPFITAEEVVFYGPNKSNPTHMPAGYLCQLNNRDLHSVSNNSSISRIHMIIDLDTDEERFK